MLISTYDEETAIIGAICREQDVLRIVERYVEPRHFLFESCREVYQLAVDYGAEGKTFDPLIAADALKDRIPKVRDFLAECMEIVPTTANTEEYAKLLRAKADERELRERIGAALEEQSGAKLAETIESICSEQIQNRAGNRMKPLKTVMERTYNGLFEKPENRVDTGYSQLDGMLKGMWGGELIVMAARPAVGKSAFVLSVAENVARCGKTVQLYSLEMEDTEIGERELARWTSSTTMNEIIDRGFETCLDDGKLTDLARAYTKTAELPIMIDDSPNVRPSKVRAQAMTQKNLGLIVVDYGGLMTPDRKQDSRNLELGAISRDLKNLAKELKIPVIMLAQLNRGVADTQQPTLRELRDSGELEQNANKVVFLWNADKENGEVGVSVAKNRKGKCGEVVMQFDGNHMRFYETEKRYEEQPRKRGKTNVYDED